MQRENILTKHNKARSDDDDNGRCCVRFVFLFAVVAIPHIQRYSCVCTNEKCAVVKFHCCSCRGCRERNVFPVQRHDCRVVPCCAMATVTVFVIMDKLPVGFGMELHR